MASKKDFKDYLCRPYCMFFKDGQKEEMACRGAEVVEKLVSQNLINPDDLPRFKKDHNLWGNYRKIFDKYICTSCAFRDQDCDFMSESFDAGSDEDIEPCGGFIMLVLLIENDFIDMSDLEAGL